MWKFIFGLLAVLVIVLISVRVLGGASERAADKPAEKKEEPPKPSKAAVKELMDRKLQHSQKLLAALVMNDLDKAGKEAENLLRIRKQAAWFIVKTKDYDIWSREFTTSAEQLIKAAKDKNLDAARLRYLEMTTTCFNCHTYVRDLGDISLESSAVSLPDLQE